MSNEKKHDITTIDRSILNRITEDEVSEWLAAKALTLSSDSLPISSIDLELWHRKSCAEESYVTAYKIYAASKFGYGATLAHAAAEAREKIADNPRSRAAEKRREAQAALKEAEKLEALANSLG